jgi:hypothetical protein
MITHEIFISAFKIIVRFVRKYFKFVSFSMNVIVCTPPGHSSRSTAQTVPLLDMNMLMIINRN